MTNDVSIALPVRSIWIRLLRWFGFRLAVYLAAAVLSAVVFIAASAIYAHYSPTPVARQTAAPPVDATTRSGTLSIGEPFTALPIQTLSFVVTVLFLIIAARRNPSWLGSRGEVAAYDRDRMSEDVDAHAEIALLLPWYAAGELSRRESQSVEKVLAASPRLARDYDHIKEEIAATIQLNESLGAPSSAPMKKLFAAIDTEPLGRNRQSFNLGEWLSDRLSNFSPRTLVWSGFAAVLAVILQAGLFAGMFVSERTGADPFSKAAIQTSQKDSIFLLIRFTPQATTAEVTYFLQGYKASIVAGPRGAGTYLVGIDLPSDEAKKIIQQMRQDWSKVVSSVEAADYRR